MKATITLLRVRAISCWVAVSLFFLPSVVSGLVATPVNIAAKASSDAATFGPLTGKLPLRINGQWYDLQSYADKHKGGRWLLEYARGRDVTPIFYAIHMHGQNRAEAVLQTLPQLDPSEVTIHAEQGPYVLQLDQDLERNAPVVDSALRRDLQELLRLKFPTLDSMKATPEHWARTLLCFVSCLTCWVGWFQGNVAAITMLPLAQWLLAAHTVHEATHGALHSNPAINYWAQFTAHPILFNVFVWIPQHILSHHQYTNDPQHDVDVHHFAAARLAQQQVPYKNESKFNQGWTFVWKGCLTTLGTSVLQPLRTLLEKPTPNFEVNITPVPSAVSKLTLLFSMLPSFFVLLYPLASGVLGTMHPLIALWAEVWPWVGMSVIWTVMTQTSHIQESCQWRDNRDACWTEQQISTSLDYSVGNPTMTWATAGLNSQGLHHALPTVSSAHFPDLYRDYEVICRRHGVEPRQSKDLGTACRECLSYVFELNK